MFINVNGFLDKIVDKKVLVNGQLKYLKDVIFCWFGGVTIKGKEVSYHCYLITSIFKHKNTYILTEYKNNGTVHVIQLLE